MCWSRRLVGPSCQTTCHPRVTVSTLLNGHPSAYSNIVTAMENSTINVSLGGICFVKQKQQKNRDKCFAMKMLQGETYAVHGCMISPGIVHEASYIPNVHYHKVQQLASVDTA